MAIEFMKPSRRCTAFGSARSPIRISGFSFSPVASNFFCASAAIASTAARATASLSATTMMPLLMSEGGRLKVAIGTSDSCASATTTRAGVAVVGRQDDAVGALGDAVLDLLELAVGVMAAVELHHLDAGVLERLHDGPVAGDPEAGRQVLEGVADRAALLGARGGERAATQRGHGKRAACRPDPYAHRSPSRSGVCAHVLPPFAAVAAGRSTVLRAVRKEAPTQCARAVLSPGVALGKAFLIALRH